MAKQEKQPDEQQSTRKDKTKQQHDARYYNELSFFFAFREVLKQICTSIFSLLRQLQTSDPTAILESDFDAKSTPDHVT